jgi:hypothetical protein
MGIEQGVAKAMPTSSRSGHAERGHFLADVE